ncbi:anti-sigma-I factor RsgI family protein [Bacillus sp. USDA818B3_A]|uniref:anti-sigma-I factor RsgI family protein n=1 Tax=Bacillus sp. USDA818B3_A TaxID=2698834 RepID=UPI001370FA75|nr:anti-sigma factor domain-containing protein [Bacillus sp. USDA818B3_A]
MKKGIIMEIDDCFITLLTPEGEFLRSKKQDKLYNLGEEVHFFPITNVQNRISFTSIKNIFTAKTVWTITAALFILLGSLIPIRQNNKAYAYMTIDANSSIELGVNKNMQVVEMIGINKEGKQIISELKDWKKKDVSIITESILGEIKQAGGDESEPVIISAVSTADEDEQSEKELKKNIDEIKVLAGKADLELTFIKATQKDRKKAHELGMSTGEYQQDKFQQEVEKQGNKEQDNKQDNKQQKKNQSGEKEKQKPKNHTKNDDKAASSPSAAIPAGQQKKVEDKQTFKEPAPDAGQSAAKKTAHVAKLPPGQVKKAVDPSKTNVKKTKPKTQKVTQQKIPKSKDNAKTKEKTVNQPKKINQKPQQNNNNK